MTITCLRTADIQQGKVREAFEWAVKATAYMRKNCKHVKTMNVVRNIGGPVNQLHWLATYDSMEALGAAYEWLGTDAGFQELLAEGREKQAFDELSTVDMILATVG